METKRYGKSGSGSVRTASRALGSGVSRSVNRPSAPAPEPARAISVQQALRQVLDGQVTRRAAGFAAESCDRIMFIPFETTCDAAVALVITKMQGLISAKLDKMEPEAADILYATTLPLPDSEN